MHLLGAQRALLAAEWALKRRKTGDLLALSGAVWNGASPADADAGGGGGGGGKRNVGPGPSLADAGLRAQAARDARAVQIAAKYGVFRPLCLTRAMALQAMLGRRGLHAAVRVGARRNGNQLEAHAWVELDGVVLGDTQEHVAGFAPLGNFNRL